jgi:hypothetical protein
MAECRTDAFCPTLYPGVASGGAGGEVQAAPGHAQVVVVVEMV